MTLYVLDASVLITANNSYYGIDIVHPFWTWLQHQGQAGSVKLPVEVWEELSQGNTESDRLFDWISQANVEAALVLDEDVDIDHVQHIVRVGYAPDLTDSEIEEIGRDPFLIAHAFVDPQHRCIVTTEVSKPSKTRANRRLPDVCRDVGVECIDTFTFARRLGFRTDWDG